MIDGGEMGERTSTLIHMSRPQSGLYALLFLPSVDPHRKDLRALSTVHSHVRRPIQHVHVGGRRSERVGEPLCSSCAPDLKLDFFLF